jgi:formylglycine-generating enzyme required for sulfatase activity
MRVIKIGSNMKKYTSLLVVLIFAGLVFWSCSDDSSTEPDPTTLTCEITSPLDTTGFFAGDTVRVTVEANDEDATIVEVRFLLDGTGFWSDGIYPYTAKIATNLLAVGTHSIKAVAENNDGKEVETSVFFGIKPKSPTNLSITQQNVYTFSLSWNDNSTGEDGFKIERKIDDGVYTQIAVTTEKTYIDGTINKKGYSKVYYQVRAYKEIYNSNYAMNYATVGFPAPSSVTYSKINFSTIKLSWNDNSNGEDGFKIDKKIGDYAWVLGFASVSENIKTWTDNNAEINQNITYRVYAYKGANTSGVALTSLINNSIPAPTNFSAPQTSITSSVLSWTDNSLGEDKFVIERKLSTETNYSILAEIPGSDTATKTWADTTVPNLIYDYRVRASFDTFYSAYALKTLNNLFPAPTNFTGTQTNITIATFVWNDNSIGEEKFEIERKLSSEANFIKVGEVTGSATATKSWTDTNLTQDLTYDYRVKAVRGSFESEYLTKTGYLNNFLAPENLTSTFVNYTSVTLNWSDSYIGEDKFEIERKLSSESTYIKIGEVSGSETSTKTYTDSTIEPNQTYNYRVRIVDGAAYSDYANVTYANPIQTPTGLIATVASETSIKLDWTDNSNGEQGFKIDRKVGVSGTWVTDYAIVGANVKTFTDTGLTTGTTYYYRVRAYYSTYYSSYASEAYGTLWAISRFVSIPTGNFSMGQTDVSTPVHTVNITRSYYLGKYEITQGEWMQYMPSENYICGNGSNYPAYYVNWYKTLVYCNKRSISEGFTPCYTISGSTNPSDWGIIPTDISSIWDEVICDFNSNGYRLPTEAEWEYAARFNDGRTFPWGDTAPDSASCNFDIVNNMLTTIVGSYPSGNSSLGLCDMAGNVSEWVWDEFESYPSTEQTDPSSIGTRYFPPVLRGGYWTGSVSIIKSAYRLCDNPSTYSNTVFYGFRIARTK